MAQVPKMIERRMVFGACENVKDGIHYLDESNIVWVAGKSLVLLDTQLGTQQIIPCSPTCEAVTTMALSSNRRVLAVAESGKTAAIVIYLYDPVSSPKLKRKKVLQIPDLGSTEYISLYFSQDGKQLVALGGFPEWKLVYWNVERMKMIASCPAIENALTVKDPRYLTHCSICPSDSALVCVSGTGSVRFFRLTENHIFAAPGGVEEEGTRYLSHIWVQGEDSQLIASTANGDLLFFDHQEYKFLLPLSPSDGLSINAMAAYTKGFVCGGDMGLITIFERTNNKEMYRKVRTFRFNGDADPGGLAPQGSEIPVILSFTLTPPPAEEYLAFLTNTKQLYCLNLPNADFTKADDAVFQPVGQPFHAGPITAVDTCAQRPLVVTGGRDRSIFLWNSITNVVELRKRFSSEILSVAIHPSGLLLLVGFADGLKLMNIYEQDIREFKSIGIRNCSACCFSSGGQFFAAMHSTTVHVYFTYTGELLGHLRGHNGKVKSLYFMPPDDTRLITTGTDGAVCEFSLSDFHKVNDNVLKSVTYNCGVSDVATVWAAGNDRKLRQFSRAKLQPTSEHDLSNASMHSMTISQKMKLLFGGCDDGTVRVFNTYLGEKIQHDKESGSGASRNIMMEAHSTHTGTVTHLSLSYDEAMMVSVGEDGLVVFWDVVAPHRGLGRELNYSNELLMDRRDLETTATQIRTLIKQVIDLKQRMAQQQSKRERVHDEQLAKLEREYSDEITQQRHQIDGLEADKNEQAIRFTEFMAELEQKSIKTLDQTMEDYAAKTESLRSRSDQLKALIKERRLAFEGQAAELRKKAMLERAAAHEQQQHVLQELDGKHNGLMSQKERHEVETEEMGKMIEEDNDLEIAASKEAYEQRRRQQEEEMSGLQSSNNALISKENLNRADLEAKMADVTEKLRQQTTLEAQIDAAKRDIEALSNELKERGETISEKDRRIDDLKKKNQELEKFKFVLEYKTKELKAQIDPRDEEIRQANEKLSHMENESEQYQRSNENLVLQIRGLRQKRAAQQKELDELSVKLRDAEAFQARLWTDLSDAYEARSDDRSLKEVSKALFEKYSQPAQRGTRATPLRTSVPKGSSRTAADELREYNRERDHLERNLAGLKKKVTKDAESSRSERSRIIGENVVLVREVNDLRKEARTLAAKAGLVRPTDPTGASAYEEEWKREVEVQKAEIARLSLLIEGLEKEMEAKGIPKPTSSGVTTE